MQSRPPTASAQEWRSPVATAATWCAITLGTMLTVTATMASTTVELRRSNTRQIILEAEPCVARCERQAIVDFRVVAEISAGIAVARAARLRSRPERIAMLRACAYRRRL
jgi:hypothetical protein